MAYGEEISDIIEQHQEVIQHLSFNTLEPEEESDEFKP